eukprot:4899979-Amphidinium_carterae.1
MPTTSNGIQTMLIKINPTQWNYDYNQPGAGYDQQYADQQPQPVQHIGLFAIHGWKQVTLLVLCWRHHNA